MQRLSFKGVRAFLAAVVPQLALVAMLSGCGGGVGDLAAQTPPPSGQDQGHTLKGTAMGGRQPIVGASIHVWAASATPGAPAVLVGAAKTNKYGRFSVPLKPEPATGQVVYVVANGGNAGGGENAATRLATVAGEYCSGPGCNFPNFVNINELSTVAMAYSLEGYMDLSGGNVNISGPSAGPGLDNAVQTFLSLVDPVSGSSIVQTHGNCIGGTDEPYNCNALRKLDSLANLASSCVNGAVPDTPACTGLLSSAGGAQNTLTALSRIATEPALRNQGSRFFNLLSGRSIFVPTLDHAPHDWTISLAYTGGGLRDAMSVAIDGLGNVWVTNDRNNVPAGTSTISKFSPVGHPLSPPTGFSGGGLQGPSGIAIDARGHAWVANWNGGDGRTVSEFNPDGTPVAPTGHPISGISPGPFAITVAPDDTIWVGNYGSSTLAKLDSTGSEIAHYQGGGLALPVGIGVDDYGDVWLANYSNSSVSEFDPTSATWLSPNTGYKGGGLAGPQGLALAMSGNAWITNFYGPDYPDGPSTTTEIVGGNTPSSRCPTNPGINDTGCPVSPPDGYQDGGLFAAKTPAVDSAGHVFISNYHGSSISELSTADGTSLGPPDGYKNPAIKLPSGLAIDASGNLWVATNITRARLIKFIGIAAPVKTPMSGLPQAP